MESSFPFLPKVNRYCENPGSKSAKGISLWYDKYWVLKWKQNSKAGKIQHIFSSNVPDRGTNEKKQQREERRIFYLCTAIRNQFCPIKSQRRKYYDGWIEGKILNIRHYNSRSEMHNLLQLNDFKCTPVGILAVLIPIHPPSDLGAFSYRLFFCFCS